MANLLIRNVDDGLHARLKARAAAHHRSLEEEVRELLRIGAAREQTGSRSLASLARQLFGGEHGADLMLPPRGTDTERQPPDFSGPEYDPG